MTLASSHVSAVTPARALGRLEGDAGEQTRRESVSGSKRPSLDELDWVKAGLLPIPFYPSIGKQSNYTQNI